MSTIIYTSPIFGPVKSRRLGVSLGINLLPGDGKICTFDCLYCECGFNSDHRPRQKMPTREEVREALEARLRDMQANGPAPDVLTFAGNGEPTAHPHFAAIMDDTLALRDRYFPLAKVSVLSNATMIHRPDIHAALMRVDNNIQKMDTVNAQYINRLDRPTSPGYDIERIIADLIRFEGHVIIQTMFLKGHDEQGSLDNTTEEYVGPWLEAVKRIRPEKVMVYTIDRETPYSQLAKATKEELDSIRDRVLAAGIDCSASY